MKNKMRVVKWQPKKDYDPKKLISLLKAMSSKHSEYIASVIAYNNEVSRVRSQTLSYMIEFRTEGKR